MKSTIKKSKEIGHKSGSALILAVVLTSLLALVGVMFVMTARVDKVAASSISENRELNFAIESVIAKISQELVLDVPGMPKGSEDYYDYPDEKNTWLASLEPYEETGNYYWKQISDVTGFLEKENWDTQDIKITNSVPDDRFKAVIEDHKKIELENDGDLEEQLADADGDGVADSKWIVLDDITSGKGKPIYAAIRVVDNGGMLNVNTAYKFDANETDSDLVDGYRLAQIHMLDFVKGVSDDVDDLHSVRCDGVQPDLVEFNDDCARRIVNPDRSSVNYVPYDIGDELELRNRYVLDVQHGTSRIEAALPITLCFPDGATFKNRAVPIDTSEDFRRWKDILNPLDANDSYNFRHLLTTYNTDRIICPNPIWLKMLNINRATSAENLYNVLVATIDPNIVESSSDRERLRRRFAQLAANIVDYVDDDIDVTVFDNLPDPEDHDKDEYYGFEAQPFISEVAMVIDTFPEIGPSYFAVELYNPFDEDINLEDFVLELYDSDGTVDNIVHTVTFDDEDVIEAGECFVIAKNLNQFDIYNETDENTKQDKDLKFFGGWKPPKEGRPPRDRRREPDESKSPAPTGWQNDTSLRLKRDVDPGPGEEWIYIDKQFLDRHMAPADEQRSYGRDSRDWHIVYQTLEEDEGRSRRSRGSLGQKNIINPSVFRGQHDFSFFLPKPISKSSDPPSLRPYTKFRTVGDITRILTIGNNTDSDETIGEQLEQTRRANEEEVRLDLENPYHRNIFQYLTVFDPTADGIDNDGDKNTDEINFMETPEYQIAGRININTAPWYVIKQLPWVTGKIARAIVAYRDKLNDPVNYQSRWNAIKDELDSPFEQDDIREDEGFESIGELNFVIDGDDEYSIAKHALDGDELTGFPDLTTDGGSRGDGIRDDFEERDIIFSRISNLVTVRSDVFTAYILVRIGANGPQKRVIAILDRSNVYAGNGKVRIVAQHFVPDPR